MRIAYVCLWDLDVEDGVTKKIRGQVAEWRRLGAEVEVFALPRRAGSLPARFAWHAPRLARSVRRWRPDAVYLRYDLLPPALALLPLRVPTVVEVNSAESHARSRFRRSRLRRAYGGWLARVVLGRAAGVVYTARSFAAGAPGPARARPSLVVANGADPGAVPPLPAPANERPTLVFLGAADQPWQGADKVLRLARANPGWRFELVGAGEDLLGELPPNATAHGFLPGDAYRPVLARADVALGTLALHRKELDEVAPLKLREYLLHGIPSILAYHDTDFPSELPWYLLRIPNTEANVEDALPEIRAFVEAMRGRRVPREEAVAAVGTPAREARRLAFIRDVAGRDA